MKTKLLEVRDRATCIGVMATQIAPVNVVQMEMLGKTGWGLDVDTSYFVAVTTISNGISRARMQIYPRDWNDRTMSVAHRYIEDNFDTLSDGDVVDVRHILGEVEHPASSELSVSYG